MSANSKQLFLIDGLGALLSAFMIGIVLATFEPVFGVPQPVTNVLAIIPVVFAIYSLGCYWLLRKNWQQYLRLIAIANLLYCCLTAGLVIYHYQSLTLWGLLYFIGEIVVVVTLAGVELKTAVGLTANQ